MTKIDRLKQIVLTKSFKYNEKNPFRLSSGAYSYFYFDCKKTTLDPEGANLIGEILYERTKNLPIEGAGGLTLGADPLAAALMHTAWFHGKRIHQFVVRKDLKKHGAIKWIEGTLAPNASVLILDDVVTTGGSVIQAIDRTKEDGFDIYGVIVLVDREEFDGMEKIRQSIPGKPVHALIKRSEIMEIYKQFQNKIVLNIPNPQELLHV